MSTDCSSSPDSNGMMKIVNYYKQAQIDSCIILLTEMCGSSVNHFNYWLTRHNLAVCKYQQSFIIDDPVLRNSAWEGFFDVWSAVSSLASSRSMSQLALVSACNILYCAAVGENGIEHNEKITLVGFQALERIAAQYGIASCPQLYLPREKLMFLLKNLACCKSLDKLEAHIILYMCTIMSLGDENDDILPIIEQILKNCADSYENQNANYFLLSPSEMKLVTSKQDFFQFVSELASLLLYIISCNSEKWCSKFSDKKIEHSQWTDLYQFIKLYEKVQTKQGTYGQLDIVANGNKLSFAINLLEAIKFSSEKQHSLAIKLCSLMVCGTVSHTKLCSLPLMYTALQFQVLGEREFQIKALKVAEDCLLHCPVAECSFHVQPVSFLLGKLNLFRVPTLLMIQYHLGHALLENQEYGKAAVEYQKLQNVNYRMEWRPNICNFPPPRPSAVGHEHVLSLLLSQQFDMALQLIPSLEQDYLTFFLHAEVVALKKQLNQSIQLLHRAVCQISCCSFPTKKVRDVLTAKLHWRLSQMFQKCGNIKDSFFQLKTAVELCPNDSNLIQHTINYGQQLGISLNAPQMLVEDAKIINDVSTFLSVQNDLSLKYLIEICDVESTNDICKKKCI